MYRNLLHKCLKIVEVRYHNEMFDNQGDLTINPREQMGRIF